jgi:glucose-1-phosphate cytidylyltransferase
MARQPLKTILLCGGFGTRIRDVTDNIPKPMIPIGHNPILWHIMKSFGAAGFREFVICLGYKGDVIKQYFLNYHSNLYDLTIKLGIDPRITYHGNGKSGAEDWEVTLADTGLPTMTGGRVRMVQRYLGSDDIFMLTYGDGVSNVDLTELVAFHRRHGKIMTVTGVYPPGRFGELTVKAGTQVIAFNEKPQASGGLISGGFFVCSRRLFDYLDDRADLVLEQEPMQRLTADGQLQVFRHEGFWHPMDTYRDYKFLNELWDQGRAPWKTW